MTFAEDDHVIEKLSSTGSYPPLGDRVLPRAAVRRAHGIDSKAPDRSHDLRGEDLVAVEKEVARGTIGREGLPKLLDHPTGAGIRRHIHSRTQGGGSALALPGTRAAALARLGKEPEPVQRDPESTVKGGEPRHESDSRRRSGVSSAVGRAEAGRRKAQQFCGGPRLRTHRWRVGGTRPPAMFDKPRSVNSRGGFRP